MLVDWFTVVAQIANFAILVWLLKRFLYRPVLEAMAARDARVRATVAAADEQKAAAVEERNCLHAEQEALARERESLLKSARDEAAALRSRLLDQTRNEAGLLRSEWRKALEREWEE